jgi:hypothetical protein
VRVARRWLGPQHRSGSRSGYPRRSAVSLGVIAVASWVGISGTEDLTLLKRLLPGGSATELAVNAWNGGVTVTDSLLLLAPTLAWVAAAAALATHPAALRGVDRVFLVPPVESVDPMPLAGPFLAEAQRLGVRHLAHDRLRCARQPARGPEPPGLRGRPARARPAPV